MPRPAQYKNAKYCAQYDAYYYEEQDVWMETACAPEEECQFCAGRPVRPSFVGVKPKVIK